MLNKSGIQLNENVAEVHLDLLEKAILIGKIAEGYRSTPIGTAYLKNFEDFVSETSSVESQKYFAHALALHP